MSLKTITRRLSASHKRHQQDRALARALELAPTDATRQEILVIAGR